MIRIFPKGTKVHYSGGIVFGGGSRLPGWACCCFGDRAEKIRDTGTYTEHKKDVTCKGCLKMIEKQEAYKAKNPEHWKRQKDRGFCL